MSGTAVALVRHGRTDWNRTDRLQGSSNVPLDDVGRQQARSAARVLGADGWGAILASPLRRAAETAAIIGLELGLGRAETSELLVERTYGLAEGLTREQALRAWPDGVFPGQESTESLTARGLSALDAIARTQRGEPVIVVAHGALIRATLTALMPAPAPRILNGSVTTLAHTEGRWAVREINLVEA
ncbi:MULTISPECIES: histidine phosphatase family protein [unclassified Rhodococcus (in: high G+C Gram-positive bacteria)]|uniref:histidine phosphatase family protein n=1 Tax=unclassified Rhodococcus (in: high G+C Gram-positive bacteria) TaxID=192944 RepID=UPI0015819BA3|nr:histidine phosphatase family protein [Rhodococcus sp. W8901]QKT12991.1 histidine phosphatase family protein [Rhodococcus sp. W8901]